jgi:hypothetical protein
MKLAIHQPSYFPWLGLLHKIARCDVYMVMDDVQLSDNAYQHRNLFLTNTGKVKYLTIPFERSRYMEKAFRELEIADHSWSQYHLNFIYNNYRKHSGFKEVFPNLELFYGEKHSTLISAVFASMKISMGLFGIRTKVIFQSHMQYDRTLLKGDLVLDLVKAAGAETYISGVGAREYMQDVQFDNHICIEYDCFRPQAYPQLGGRDFVSGMSGLDALFNLGIKGARNLLHGSVAI